LLHIGRFFSFLIFTQSVELHGRGISPLQGRYLYTGQNKHRKNAEISMPQVGFEPTITVFELFFYHYLVCEDIGTAATPGLLCQPQVIMKMIMEKQMECRLAGETKVLGENLPQRHFYLSQNPT
jgi:hypothetical protein